MDTAKKPLPRPPKPEKKKVEETPAAEGEAVAVTETAPPAEVAAESATEISAPAEAVVPTPEVPAAGETISSVVEPASVPDTAPVVAPAVEVDKPVA
jgi:hypothetical protein